MLPVGQGCVKVHLFKKTFVKFYWLPTLFMALIEYQYSKRIEPILEQLSNGVIIYSNDKCWNISVVCKYDFSSEKVVYKYDFLGLFIHPCSMQS